MAELPEGYKEIPEADRKKAKAFFDRGNTVAATGNFEYAIEMYMQGLAIDPDAVEAHEKLREISLKRKATGGKAKGFMDGMKLKRPTRDDQQNMINNETLLAYDPGNTDYMVGLMQNALRAGFYDTVLWIGPILQKANADSPKPELNKFLVLRDAYKSLARWKLAVEACNYACLLRPDDMELQRETRDLAAREAINRGKFDTASNFRDSMADKEGQQKLLQEDKDIRNIDQMSLLIDAAEKEWRADPNEPGKINKYAETLVKTGQMDYENKAIDLLQDAYDKTKQFRFRQKIGQIRMGQMARQERVLRQQAQANPSDTATIQEYRQFVQQQLEEELSEFQLASENYPTDASLRYNVAVRLYRLKRFDQAIPFLQHLSRDPKYKVDAAIALGKAFLESGFVDEAVDTLGVIIADYPVKGDPKAIDMVYTRGRALELKGEKMAAIKDYSQVAQWDFNFRDVQARIKKLRTEVQNPTA